MRRSLVLLALCSCGRIADVPDAGTDAGPCSDDFASATRWAFFDIADITPPQPGFGGGAYVDSYVYFAPGINGTTPTGRVVRANATSTFTVDSSWDAFDLATIDPSFTSFQGAAADAHAVYLMSGSKAVVVRHDASASFASSWTMFDVSKLDPKQDNGYTGALALDQSIIFFGTWFARYDATMAFDDPTAWRTADFVGGCSGNAFDGRYAYFACAQTVERYDTTLPLNSPVPWTSHQLSTTPSSFLTAAFDGQFAYFAEGDGTTIARFDTKAKAPFDLDASWTFVDLKASVPAISGFQDMRFDGRYIYATPSPTSGGSVIARFDTHGTFTDLGAWTTLDLLTLDPRAQHFYGSVFDGRYLYLVPSNNGDHVAARFDTKACGSD